MFYTIPNMSAEAVEPVEAPTSSVSDKPASKALYTAWMSAPATKDTFISLVAGTIPTLRVNSDNPAAYLHGVIADYDTPMTDTEREKLLRKLDFKPAFISESFSGGTHAVWIFERPIPLLPDGASTNALLTLIAKKLHLREAFGPLDMNAFLRPAQFYHIGWNWREAGGTPVSCELTYLWQDEALRRANWSRLGVEVPLEKVAAEVRKRYPGRWKGAFELGSRGVRFWDENADNETAAVVRPSGMVCYTGGVPFMPWSRIFGEAFCTEAVQEGEGRAVAEGYCINNAFWFKMQQPGTSGKPCRCWMSYNRQNTESLLASRYGLRPTAGNDEEMSQVKRAVGAIINTKSLSGAIPMLYVKDEVVKLDGRFYLNTATTEALPPAKGRPAWGEGFPWISAFLQRLFGDEQLPFFLSWLARAYKGAVDHAPTRGHAIYIAGTAGCGKSFTSAQIIAPLLGGRQEATDYLCGMTRFNRELFGSGVWAMDDAAPLTDQKSHLYYSNMIKKMVANDSFMYEAKHVEAVKIPWMGRLVVTCNTDSTSILVLPEIDLGNKDKLMFFKVEAAPMEEADPEGCARKELPAFGAFLYHYEMPEQCKGGSRYGVKGYLHPELYSEAVSSGTCGTFQDLFSTFLHNHFGGRKSDVLDLNGTALEIYNLMALDIGTKEMMQGFVSARNIGTRLGQLLAKGDFTPLQKDRDAKQRRWHIGKEAFYDYKESSEHGGSAAAEA